MEVSKRLRKAREELAVADEQLGALSEAADDARIRSLVSETPLAARESQDAQRNAEAMASARESLASQVKRLETVKSEIAVVHHKVRSGETLYSIANAYRTTVAALKRDNRNIAVIRPGMILNIPVAR